MMPWRELQQSVMQSDSADCGKPSGAVKVPIQCSSREGGGGGKKKKTSFCLVSHRTWSPGKKRRVVLVIYGDSRSPWGVVRPPGFVCDFHRTLPFLNDHFPL